jgi:hypothetical protein
MWAVSSMSVAGGIDHVRQHRSVEAQSW